MASKTSPIRTSPSRKILTALCLVALPGSLAAATEKKSIKSAIGTTHGLVEPSPTWSAGVQFGNYGATGLTAQKVEFYEGALNLGLGMSLNSFALSADYIFSFEEDFSKLSLAGGNGYLPLRGKLSPFIGGGAQIARGLSIRVPFGLQYTMLKDPFNFFGGATLIFGNFFSEGGLAPQLWFNLGARILL